MTEAAFRERVRNATRLKRMLANAKVGLPRKVTFNYAEGTVVCLPKEKKWIVQPNNKKEIIHFQDGRNDVTKHKARLYLKMAMIGQLRDDTNHHNRATKPS